MIPLDDLPQSVREIAEVIGREDALKLIGQLPRCHAGSAGHKSSRVIMYVPKRLPPDHRLVDIIGFRKAMKLVDVFGGEVLQPANCRGIYTKFRDRAIAKMLETGSSSITIARVMNVSERHVRNFRRKKERLLN